VNQLKSEILVGQRYRFLNRMGVDLYTETWKAFDTRLGRPVALRLLSEHARGNTAAQDDLRARMSGRPDASPPRVLDGGEDPLYGPFVVSEVVEPPGTTQRLPGLDAAGSTPSPWALNGGRLLLIGVIGGIVLLLAAFAVAAYVLEPGKQSPPVAASVTPQQVSGAQSGAPATPRPTVPPTLAATQQAQTPPQPTSRPTSPSTSQPTAQPAQPAQQASAQLTPSASPQARRPAGSPVDTIRQHYTFIDAKRYAEGYALMDAHLRSLNSAADYQSWFVDKISVKPVSVDVASQTDTEAVVRSVVDTTDRVDGQSVTKRVSEEFVLHAEDGAWRIDQVSALKPPA
jgi:hypothetical protein